MLMVSCGKPILTLLICCVLLAACQGLMASAVIGLPYAAPLVGYYRAPFSGSYDVFTSGSAAASANATSGVIQIDTSGTTSAQARAAVYVQGTPMFNGAVRIIVNTHTYGRDDETVYGPWGSLTLRSSVYLKTDQSSGTALCQFRSVNLSGYVTRSIGQPYDYFPSYVYATVPVTAGHTIRIWAGTMTDDRVLSGRGYFRTTYRTTIDSILVYRVY